MRRLYVNCLAPRRAETRVPRSATPDELTALHERAVASSPLSAPLWLSYVTHAVATEAAPGSARAVCERALAAAGLHFWAGHSLWDAARAVEGESPEAAPAVRALFRRELACGLATSSDTAAQLASWEAALPPHLRQPPAVVPPEAASRAAARAGVEAPMQGGDYAAPPQALAALVTFDASDPARVWVAHERVVGARPADAAAWLRYGSALSRRGLRPSASSVLARAVKAVPTDGRVWAAAIRAAELADASGAQPAALAAALSSAPISRLSSRADAVLAAMDFHRRRGDAASASAVAEPLLDACEARYKSAQLRGGGADTHAARVAATMLRVGRYAAAMEAGDASRRAAWDALLRRQGMSRCAPAWVAAAAAAPVAAPLAAEARVVFSRAFSRRFDGAGQREVISAWLDAEREGGTAEEYAAAEAKARAPR